jgi:hypothetical protein
MSQAAEDVEVKRLEDVVDKQAQLVKSLKAEAKTSGVENKAVIDAEVAKLVAAKAELAAFTAKRTTKSADAFDRASLDRLLVER